MIFRTALRCYKTGTSTRMSLAMGRAGRCVPRNRQCLLAIGPRRSSKAAFSSIPSLPVDEVAMDCQDQSQVPSELAAIVQPYFRNQQPVVVRGAVKETRATKLWSSWDYWQSIVRDSGGGEDPMVAVEIGGSYGSERSQRAEIPFSAYLQFLQLFEERHGRQGIDSSDHNNTIPSEELVYMAQNDLLGPLYKDVWIPDFCQNGSHDEMVHGGDAAAAASASNAPATIGLGRLYSVMMWLGPRGCFSPLHYDPLDNCFMQHVGRKKVLLLDPSRNDSGWHYAGHEGQQSNTSPIDPRVLLDEDSLFRKEQEQKYPLFFEEAPQCLECLLEPGDFLYIPSKWWHHVTSIDTSASVNVWWR